MKHIDLNIRMTYNASRDIDLSIYVTYMYEQTVAWEIGTVVYIYSKIVIGNNTINSS